MVLTAVFSPDSSGFLAGVFASEDEIVSLFIPEGTGCLDRRGDPLTGLEFIIDRNPPSPPEGSIVGRAYRLEPEEATFDPPVTLSWAYQHSDIPERVDELDLYLAYHSGNRWIALDSSVDAGENLIEAELTHLGTFALIAPPPQPAPAAFSVSSLSVSPGEVDKGSPVVIEVLLSNKGETAGEYDVTLRIDGVKEETRKVELDGNTEKKIIFTASRNVAGTYQVEVNGRTAYFTVTEPKASPQPQQPSAEPSPPPPQPEPQQPSSLFVKAWEGFGAFVKACIEWVASRV